MPLASPILRNAAMQVALDENSGQALYLKPRSPTGTASVLNVSSPLRLR
jgi:hypothetical protein